MNRGRFSHAQAKDALRKLRRAVRVYPLAEDDVDAAIDSPWPDFEDACVHRTAVRLKADAIVTRNQKDYLASIVRVLDCEGLFAYLENEKGISYAEIPW